MYYLVLLVMKCPVEGEIVLYQETSSVGEEIHRIDALYAYTTLPLFCVYSVTIHMSKIYSFTVKLVIMKLCDLGGLQNRTVKLTCVLQIHV